MIDIKEYLIPKIKKVLSLFLKKEDTIPTKVLDNRRRIDLTEWVVHFVHDRKPEDNFLDILEEACILEEKHPEDESMELSDEDFRFPDYYDNEGKQHFIHDRYIEEEYGLAEDAKAFDVLCKILHDGFIHSSWSYRNYEPSIYGPVSAVCFTEMPLYALVEYAKVRGKRSGYVGNYGVAFRRNELFAAGARPVIYGLSTPFEEHEYSEDEPYQGRLMSEKCGIGINEQYRYVSTSLHKNKGLTIDWTHEREWRWPLPMDKLRVPGLPFFLSKEYSDFFTDVIIIVGTDKEQELLLDYLKNLYDSGGRNTGLEYNKSMIAAARVLSLQSVSKLKSVDQKIMKIEDLPIKQMKLLPSFSVSKRLDRKVRNAVKTAGEIAVETVENYLRDNPDFNEDKGAWGFVHVTTSEVSAITQALIDAGLANAYSDGRYYIKVREYRTSNLTLLEEGAMAASKYLTKKLGQNFGYSTRLD